MGKTGRGAGAGHQWIKPGAGRSRDPQINEVIVSPFLFVKKAVWLRESNEAHAASAFHIYINYNYYIYVTPRFKTCPVLKPADRF